MRTTRLSQFYQQNTISRSTLPTIRENRPHTEPRQVIITPTVHGKLFSQSPQLKDNSQTA